MGLAFGRVGQLVEQVCVTKQISGIDEERLEEIKLGFLENKPGTVHFQWCEDQLLKRFGEALACQYLDQSSEDRLIDAVEKTGARVKGQRGLCSSLAKLLKIIKAGLGGMRVVVRGWVGGAHRRHSRPRGVIAIARTMVHQVLDQQWSLCRTHRFPFSHSQVFKAGDVLGHRIFPLEESLLVQQMHGDDSNGFGHRPDGKQGFIGDVPVPGTTGVGGGAIDLLSIPDDHQKVAASGFLINQGFLIGLQILIKRITEEGRISVEIPVLQWGTG